MFDSIDSSNTTNDEDKINVLIRIRKRENNSHSTLLEIFGNKIITSNISYQYDYIAGENSTQNEIFENCAKKICDYSLEGYNGTIFAYGQTGSGKTHTLFGPKFSLNNINKLNEEFINEKETNDNCNNYNLDLNDEGIGLIPRIIYYLFNKTKNNNLNNSYTFRISYLEIYNEKLNDLLNPQSKNLKIEKDMVVGLRKFLINSPQEGLKYVIQGTKLRQIAHTKMNKESSRSHAVISIYIENSIKIENGIKIKKNVFHIIDLAGSERINKTGVVGKKAREAGSINKSLYFLKWVIENIIKIENQIPYRNSKLTFFLKESLGGNSKTSIIGNISPSDSNNAETISTLEFAICAKNIENKAIIKEELINFNKANILEIKKLKDKYNEIFKENEMLKQQINNDIEKMSKEMEQKNLEIDSKNEEIIKLKDKIQKYELDIFELKEKNNEKNKIFEILNEELYNIQLDLSVNLNDKDKINENESSISSKSSNVEKIFEYINNLIENNEILKKELELKDNQIYKLKEENNKNNQNLEEFNKLQSDLNSNLNGEDEMNKNELSSISSKSLNVEDFVESIKNIIENNEKLKIELSKVKVKEDRNNEKIIDDILIENNNLINEIKKKNKECSDLENKYNEIISKEKITAKIYEDKIKKLNKNEENLKDNLKNYMKGLKDIKKLLVILNSKNSDLENQIKKNQNQNNSSLISMNNFEENINDLNKEKQKLNENEKILNENFENFSFLDFNNINYQAKNISIIFKVLEEHVNIKNKLNQNFDILYELYNNYKVNINDFSNALNYKEKEIGNIQDKIYIIIDKIDDVLKCKYEILNKFNDIKKSNNKNNYKIRNSMIQQKRNYEEFKSANKENLNSSNFLNTLNISERKQMKNNLLEFNINYAFNN